MREREKREAGGRGVREVCERREGKREAGGRGNERG